MTTSLLNSLLRALLRWGAALVFCLPLRHRSHFWARACGMLFPLLLLAQLLDPLAQSTTLWQQRSCCWCFTSPFLRCWAG